MNKMSNVNGYVIFLVAKLFCDCLSAQTAKSLKIAYP